jgi:hypothetical protein
MLLTAAATSSRSGAAPPAPAAAAAPPDMKCEHQTDPDPTIAAPYFEIQRDGTVSVEPKGEAHTLHVQDGAGAFLRVYRVRADRRDEVLCARIDTNSAAYRVPGVDEWSVLEADLYGRVPDGASKEFEARRDEILKKQDKRLEQAEKDTRPFAEAWLKWKFLKDIDGKFAVTEWVRSALSNAGKLSVAKRALGDADAYLEGNSPCEERSLHHVERCDAVKAILATLRKLSVGLRSSPIDPVAVEVLLRDLRPAAEKPALPAGYCSIEPGRRALAAQVLRLLHVEMPATKQTIEVSWLNGHETHSRKKDLPIGVIVTSVPSERGAIAQVRSSPIKVSNPGEILSVFLPVFLKAAAGIGPLLQPEPLTAAPSPCAPPPEADVELVEPGPEIVAPLGTRAFVIPSNGTNVADVSICEGDKCTTEGTAPSIRSVVTINPPARLRLALFLDFGVNGGEEDAFSTPRYEAVSGSDTLTQAFVLGDEDDPRRHALLSLLIGARRGPVMAAIGPGLVDTAGKSAFNQWNVRIGYEVAEHFFLTLGTGLRFAQQPKSSTPTAIVLPRTPVAETSPPAIQTETKMAWTVGAGVAIDLSLLPSAGKDLVNSIGSGK